MAKIQGMRELVDGRGLVWIGEAEVSAAFVHFNVNKH